MSRAAAANLVWLGASVGPWRRFRAAARQVGAAQARRLREYLTRNAATAIGKRYRFAAIRSVEEYQERVPLGGYDELAPYVERIRRGERQVLTREPVRRLQPSSGSTSAAKLIPFTATLQRELRAAVGPWMVDVAMRHRAVLNGPAYWSITPAFATPASADAAVPVGFEDDAAYLGGAVAWALGAALAVPSAVARLRDVAEFRRATLLYLLRASNLRLLSVWHPSFLTLLLDTMVAEWDRLVRLVGRGFVSADATVRIPAARRRAEALGEADPACVASVWPRLALVSCWADGHAARALPDLRRRVGAVAVQPKGLLATEEGVVSIPFGAHRPLAVTSHFFEFLDARGQVRLPEALEVGATYAVVMTTGGGLYRYRLHDAVEVTGFYERAPCLRFVGKDDHVSDLFGEKLSEGFVAVAAARVLDRFGLAPAFSLVAPTCEGGRARYVWFLEIGRVPEGVADALEVALAENPHYAHCVRLGQLAPAAAVPVAAGAYRRYVARLQAGGARLGDIKALALSPLEGWAEVLSTTPRGGTT